MNMNNQMFCDAVVTDDDCLRWYRERKHEAPQVIWTRVVISEPYVLCVAARMGERVIKLLRNQHLPEPLITEVSNQMLGANAMMVELMQQGYRKFMDDLIEPRDELGDEPTDEPEEDSHGQTKPNS